MSILSAPNSLAARSLSVLQSVGAWVAIHPEQTYVATSISGLGVCKSTYCQAARRELPPSRQNLGRLAPLLAAALAAVGLLAGCAAYGPFAGMLNVTDRDQYEQGLADCQNYAEPVSPGDSADKGSNFGCAAVGSGVAVLGSVRGGQATGAVSGEVLEAGARVHFIADLAGGGGDVVLD